MTPLPRTSKPARVVIYCRCSTEGQATDGVSLDVQRARCEAQAVASDLAVVATFTDAASGKNLARPGLQAALTALNEGRADALLVLDLSRLTRSVRDLGALLDEFFRERFALLSVADSIDTRTAGGRLVLNVLASVSQWEREAVAERTSRALQHLRSQGVRLGARPVETRYRVGTDGKRVRDDEERLVLEQDEEGAATVARAVALKRQGLSLRAVAATLSAEGRRTAKGGRWAAETVRLMLARAGGA